MAFLALFAWILAACGGSRSAAPAKQERTVAVVSNSGEWARQYFDAFRKKYGIEVNLLQVSSQAELVPKIQVERKSGLYAWDVAIQPPPNLFNGLKPLNAIDPLQPALTLPEVLDDSLWLKGFGDGWSDASKSFVYSFVAQTN